MKSQEKQEVWDLKGWDEGKSDPAAPAASAALTKMPQTLQEQPLIGKKILSGKRFQGGRSSGSVLGQQWRSLNLAQMGTPQTPSGGEERESSVIN